MVKHFGIPKHRQEANEKKANDNVKKTYNVWLYHKILVRKHSASKKAGVKKQAGKTKENTGVLGVWWVENLRTRLLCRGECDGGSGVEFMSDATEGDK